MSALAYPLLVKGADLAVDIPAFRPGPINGVRSLKAHAQSHGLLAGAAVNVQLLASDATYARILTEQYSILVAENAMKWNSLRPAPDKYDFEQGDALVAFAEQHKIKVRGHNFVWHEAIPNWFAATVTKENAKRFLVDHIMAVGGHYKGKMHSWDVVNEAVLPKDGRPDGLRKSPWMELLGPDYIDIAFRTARQADPHALLTYNEYGVEYDNDEDTERRIVTLQLLRRLKAASVPLDAVGIQSHIKAGSPFTIGQGLRDYVASVRQMGLKIFITELDVNEDDLPYNDVAHRDHVIAETYRNYLGTVLAEPAVTAVLTWGVSDNHTWLNSGPTHHKKQPDRPQRSLPFDDAYQPKEAFFAIRDSFDNRKPGRHLMMPVARSSFKKWSHGIMVALLLAGHMQAQSSPKQDAYLNPALPVSQRIDDLVGRMTLDEKILQMQNEAPAIPRLHVAEYNWWNEGLHGVARSGYATVFPQAIGLAATWDTDLIDHAGDTISTEARAKYNQAQREGNYSIFYGLTLWSPNINIDRDPRWGRGQETYGEDPFLTGQIGSAFVHGLQGSNPDYLKTIATPKHFAVHSGPESERHTFDAAISPHDLEDTYLPAFRKLIVDAHAGSIMCAYNSVDGAPACASQMLLQQKLRQDWHFAGYVVSDCAAITDVAAGHKFAPDLAHAAATSVKAGTDLSCGKEYAALTDAVRQDLISEADIDGAVKRLFTARFRLGMFDPEPRVPYNSIPFSDNDSAPHAALSLRAARASMVLLKNDHAMLPFPASQKSIAVIGPNAAALPALEGNYNAIASHPVTPLAALEQRLPGHILYSQGSPYVEGVPVPVPSTAFSSAQGGSGRGLNAEYFNGVGFTPSPVLSRIDPAIDFDWNGASPAAGISQTAFSVRWTGLFTPPASGDITFDFSMAHCSTCEDGETVRVWLDGKLVFDFDHVPTHGRRAPTNLFSLTFADTKPHPIRIEYIHNSPHFGAGLTFAWNPPATALRNQAVAVACKADAVVAFLGLSPEIEGEEMPLHVKGFDGGDRTAIELPDTQMQLIDALAATGKPLVIVLMNGSALALQGAAQKASAILEAWYPGEAGGTAIADTLFGENNPSGRLPVTFYASTSQLPPFEDYSMKDRTYRYFTGQPLYAFGYGLSYTQFKYSNGKLSTTDLKAGDPIEVSVDVQNTGDRDGDETAEVYLIPKNIVGGPFRALVGFEKVQLARGSNTTIHMTIEPRQLSFVSSAGTRTVRSGNYDLFIGGSQPSTDTGVYLPFHIEGSSPIAP